MTETTDPEEFWSDLLSEEPERIRAAWKSLGPEEHGIVRRHLQAMTQEDGWQTGQRRAARAALDCLEQNGKP